MVERIRVRRAVGQHPHDVDGDDLAGALADDVVLAVVVALVIVRQLEADNRTLREDLGFFEKLIPAAKTDGLAIRALQAEVLGGMQLRWQVLVIQDMLDISPGKKARFVRNFMAGQTSIAGAIAAYVAAVKDGAGNTDSRNLRFVTGGESGTYYAFGSVIAQHATNNAGINVVGLVGNGSQANVQELVDGTADFAFCQSDVMAYAYAGSDAYFTRPAYVAIALAPVVVWGIVFAVLAACLPREWFPAVWLWQLVNISGAAGDFYCTCRILRAPRDTLVQDTGTAMTFYRKTN